MHRRLLNFCFRIFFFFYREANSLIFKLLPQRKDLLFNSLIENYSFRSDEFITYKVHFKNADFFIPSKIKTTLEGYELAIVFQGPIDYKDNFSIETVKLYKKIFPKAFLIFSTWSNENKEALKKLKALGCDVILTDPFEPNGFGNVNYQIKTTIEGIKKARSLGAKYVLKNRSDYRIYREFTFEFLKNLLDLYPITRNSIDADKVKIIERIITIPGWPGQIFMPYWIQYFIYFGRTEDVYNFFDIPFDSRNIKDRGKFMVENYGSCADGHVIQSIPNPETYMTRAFLSKYVESDMNVKLFWERIRDFFIIIDHEDLNAYWHKYDKFRNISRLYTEPGEYCKDAYEDFEYLKDWDPYKNITFADFLNIYCKSYIYEKWMEESRRGRKLQ